MLVAIAQTDPKIGRTEENLDEILEIISQASGEGADLIVFPECALQGYCFDSYEEAMEVAVEVPGSSTDAMCRACGNVHVVVGILEREDRTLLNTAAILGPTGYLTKYHKAHLPVLGVDRFCAKGNEPGPVIDAGVGRFGVLICYELRFPEVSRSLALRGADLVCNITNWPPGADANADFIGRTRALESRVYLASSDRTGEEKGVRFLGLSQMISPTGEVLARAGTEPEVLMVEIDPSKARQKNLINRPGEYELYLFRDRRPELYEALVEP